MSRVIRVAGGVFAPGHLGELTQLVPFEMVDEVLAETGKTQQRLRKLPSRVVVYLLLAAGLFEGIGYLGVWRKLVAGLEGLAVVYPSGTALWHARLRVGVAPLKALFDLLRGPASTAQATAVRWRGLLVCAIDGTTLDVPDCPANVHHLGKHRCQHGSAGYPQIRLVALVACGTRAIIDAVFGPCAQGETTQATRLLRSTRSGMIVLLDRGFDAGQFLAALAARNAHFLVRIKTNRNLPVLRRHADGSYTSVINGVKVRIIECEITISTTAGRQTGIYRLATTLLDPQRFGAFDLVTLYHQRWEIESAYFAIKSTMLHRRVLRSHHPASIAQEIYALLVVYQTLRIAITDATDSVPGTHPDRASFTIAMQTARDQLIQAAGVIAETVIDLIGAIGRGVLANLMPARRLRVSPRAVKRPLSRYAYKSLRVDRRTYKATLSIDILTGQPALTTSPDP
ncbi:MAG: IS4 family transposase [Longispora sp.]|nr:IS4 family transposase [Longispora sp. (in: high G+C Gram-positive bacteria)]